MRGNNPTEFERALGAAPAVLGLIREVQQAIATGGVSEQQAIANVAHIAAPVQANDDPWAPAPRQPAPVPVQPTGPVLPQSLAKYNTLVPGLPVQPCAQCGQSAFPCAFTSRAGKPFKKYKCGVDDKGHDNPWI